MPISNQAPPVRPAGLSCSGTGLTVDFGVEPPAFAIHCHGMELLDRITIESGKCGGRPCIRGYRLRVSDVLDLIAAGATREEILGDYPFLEDQDITAALTYAARQMDHAVVTVAA